MRKATILWASWLLVCLIMTGCNNLSTRSMTATDESDLFAQGLDQYLTTGESNALSQFVEKYPDGAWRNRAQGLIDMAAEQHQQQISHQKKDRDLNRCQSDKAVLLEDKKNLEEKLKKLKQVLIDMELRVE